MLTQKRQNEKYRALEEAIQCHSDLINQQQSRMQLYDLYHKQNHDSFEHLSKRINKIEEIDDRLRRLEQRERFGCDDPTNLKVKINREGRHYQHHNEEENSRLANLEQNYKECIKKIKRQQEELSDCHDQIDKIKRRENIESLEGHANPEKVVQKKDLKKLQKKVVRYLNERLDEIEATIRRKAKSSKSPSAKVSQFSIIDNYTIKNAKSTVNAFQMENQSTNKSEMSTILESKSNKNSNISEKPKRTKRNRDISKSRSKSKSEDKSRNKSKSKNDKGQDRSRSKSERKMKQNKKKAQKEDHSKSRSRSKHILNQSLSVSDESNIFSSKSRSKSHTNQSLSKSKSKKKQTKAPKKAKSREKSLSNTHDLCKKRPQVPANPYVKAIESKVESMAVVIKRKSRVPG